MAERKEEQLRDVSDQLLEDLEAIKRLEQEKRQLEISSPRFLELADAIAEKSREIFALAAEQRRTGNEIGTPLGVSTEQVPPSDDEESPEP